MILYIYSYSQLECEDDYTFNLIIAIIDESEVTRVIKTLRFLSIIVPHCCRD